MIDRAISSVLNQTYNNIEVVIVDDNEPSSEWRKQTEQTMSKYQNDSRVQYIKHPKNMNGSVARNTGIHNAKGTLICFLDDDDVFEPNKIEMQVDFLNANPEFHAVYCGWFREHGDIIPSKQGDLSFEVLSGINLIYTNTIMMYKKDIMDFGGWDKTFKRHQEAAFMLRYFMNGGKIGVVPKVLVRFDISDRSNETVKSNIYEQHMNHLLSTFSEAIERCEQNKKGSRKFIFCNRYRGVFFNHLKKRNIGAAISLYVKFLLKYPLSFNKNIVIYVFRKIGGRVANK